MEFTPEELSAIHYKQAIDELESKLSDLEATNANLDGKYNIMSEDSRWRYSNDEIPTDPNLWYEVMFKVTCPPAHILDGYGSYNLCKARYIPQDSDFKLAYNLDSPAAVWVGLDYWLPMEDTYWRPLVEPKVVEGGDN